MKVFRGLVSSVEPQPNFPVVVKNQRWSFFLGLVKVSYVVENRRPDLNNNFKHILDLKVGRRKFNWTFRTEYPYDSLPYQW